MTIWRKLTSELNVENFKTLQQIEHSRKRLKSVLDSEKNLKKDSADQLDQRAFYKKLTITLPWGRLCLPTHPVTNHIKTKQYYICSTNIYIYKKNDILVCVSLTIFNPVLNILIWFEQLNKWSDTVEKTKRRYTLKAFFFFS